MKNKDNPVPSLDNNDWHLIKTALYYGTSLDVTQRKDFEKLLKKLENGVETDKEQPKKKRCSGACENGQYYDCSNYCTRYGGRV